MRYFNSFRAVFKGPIIGLLSLLFFTLVLLFPVKQVWPQNVAGGVEPFLRLEKPKYLLDAYTFDQPGDYEVTFSTVLAVLVGEKNDPFAEYCPIRLAVIGKAVFAPAN